MTKKNKEPAVCKKCAKCCSYFCLEVDAPDERDDFEDLAWMLAHKNVSFHIDGEDWQLMVKNECRYLGKDGCGIYETRPRICREHDPSECDYGSVSDTEYYDADIVIAELSELYAYRDEHFPLKPRKKKKKKVLKKKK
jgi:Fe-S-cluster containining protein